uniref:Uncharacterized protein n=1 Tax=Arundo donax TaxID=35708 RepID=A0A0A9DEX5_ARUDO
MMCNCVCVYDACIVLAQLTRRSYLCCCAATQCQLSANHCCCCCSWACSFWSCCVGKAGSNLSMDAKELRLCCNMNDVQKIIGVINSFDTKESLATFAPDTPIAWPLPRNIVFFFQLC